MRTPFALLLASLAFSGCAATRSAVSALAGAGKAPPVTVVTTVQPAPVVVTVNAPAPAPAPAPEKPKHDHGTLKAVTAGAAIGAAVVVAAYGIHRSMR